MEWNIHITYKYGSDLLRAPNIIEALLFLAKQLTNKDLLSIQITPIKQ
jgi:hypothetical protein